MAFLVDADDWANQRDARLFNGTQIRQARWWWRRREVILRSKQLGIPGAPHTLFAPGTHLHADVSFRAVDARGPTSLFQLLVKFLACVQ